MLIDRHQAVLCSEKLVFAVGAGYYRDSWLVKAASVSECSVLAQPWKRHLCHTGPWKSQKHPWRRGWRHVGTGGREAAWWHAVSQPQYGCFTQELIRCLSGWTFCVQGWTHRISLGMGGASLNPTCPHVNNTNWTHLITSNEKNQVGIVFEKRYHWEGTNKTIRGCYYDQNTFYICRKIS